MSKNIVLITLSLSKGGAETQLVKLAVYLKKQGFNVSIIHLLQNNDFRKKLDDNSIKYLFMPFNKGLGLMDIVRLLKSIQVDVIISFMFAANIVARILKLVIPVKLITSVRNNEIAKRYFYLYKLTYKIDDLSTFNSIVSLTNFKNQKLTVPGKSFLMNNAISVPSTSTIDLKNDVFTFVSIAHFRPQKDYKTLFKAIQMLHNKGIQLKLVVLGQLGNAKWPFELLKEFNIEDQVKIVGFVNDPSVYIDKSDAVVLSTFWEGTPNAVLEGMSRKKPIVCTAVPGCTELLEEARCGVLSEKSNAEDLANKMKEIMSLSNEDRIQFGNNGHRYILENYEETKVLSKWEQLITNL